MRQGGLILAAEVVCVRKKKNKKQKHEINPAPPKANHVIHSSPATATTSRRRTTKHVPRVSPYSPASIDPGFVEIGLAQLSQSVKTTNATHTLTRHTQTDGQADKLNNGTLYAPQYEEAFLPIGKNGLGRFAPSALPYYKTQERHLIRFLALWSVSRSSYSHFMPCSTQDKCTFPDASGA